MTVKVRDVGRDEFKNERVAFTSFHPGMVGSTPEEMQEAYRRPGGESLPHTGDVFIEWGENALFGMFLDRTKFFKKIAKEFDVAIYEVGVVVNDDMDPEYLIGFLGSDVGYHGG